MKYTLVDPQLPSIARWLTLNRRFAGESTLRMMEYELLMDLDMSGAVLDVGGGQKAKYHSKLPDGIDYKSVNIDPSIEPTWLVEPGNPFPIEDDSFDCCISMNTLEHVYDPTSMVEEIFRVLKPGGVVHITVPWIFRIHGHPDDFTRATPSWWRITLEEAGFSSAQITPLVWGRYSTGASIVGIRGFMKNVQRHWIHMKDCLYAGVVFRRSSSYSGKRGQRICNVATGHFITAVK